MARRGDGERRIVELVRADQRRRRQVEQAGLVLVDQPAVLRRSRRSRRPGRSGVMPSRRAARSSTARPSSRWRPITAVAPRFRMPALFDGDLGDGVAEEVLVVEVDRRDDGAERVVDDVGGVEIAAHADLEQQVVGRRLGEELEGRRGGDLEEGDRLAAH